jgi:hypothetical protein
VVSFCLGFWDPQRFADHRRRPSRKNKTNDMHVPIPTRFS